MRHTPLTYAAVRFAPLQNTPPNVRATEVRVITCYEVTIRLR